MSEKKMKHLEFIQGAVGRMSSNLFLLKGWTITLIAALFALAAKDAKIIYFLIAYIPAFMFWILDGYFLAHERQYRALFDEVRAKDEANIDFSMNASAFSRGRNTWLRSIFSPTLGIYYGGLILVMFFVVWMIRREA